MIFVLSHRVVSVRGRGYLFCISRELSKVIYRAQSLGRVKGILPEAFWCYFHYLFLLRFYSAEGHGYQETLVFEICLQWKLFIKEPDIVLVADLF